MLVSDEKKKTWIEMKHKKRLTVPFSRVRKIRKKQENRQRQKRKYHLHACQQNFFLLTMNAQLVCSAKKSEVKDDVTIAFYNAARAEHVGSFPSFFP